MARRKRSGPTMAERARARVTTQRGEGVRAWRLAVSPQFEGAAWPPDTSPGGGVEYPDAPEIPVGGRAVTGALVNPGVPRDLAAWIRREERARGGGREGSSRLALDLLGLDAAPPGAGRGAARSAERKAYDAELRFLQRYAKGTHTGRGKMKPERAARISAMERARVALDLRGKPVNLWVGGQWWIKETRRGSQVRWHWFNTDWSEPEDREGVEAVLASGGAGFVAAVVASVERQFDGAEYVQLQRVAGLQIHVHGGEDAHAIIGG